MLTTRRRPRLAQIAFLVIAAFALSGKVYSPQYVLWLVPLAAMARPRWQDFLIWQAGEVVYFAAIWWHLAGYDVDDEAVCLTDDVRLLSTADLEALGAYLDARDATTIDAVTPFSEYKLRLGI